MILSALLEKALALASEGYLEVSPLEALEEETETLETRIALGQECVDAYVKARDLFVLDGTKLQYGFWMSEQRCLVGARMGVRRAQEQLAFIAEEVERQVALGTHRKAAAQRMEVRA